MTTWTTFETIDENAQRSEFAAHTVFIDRLGMHSYRQDERTRFILSYQESNNLWHVGDLGALEDDDAELSETTIGTMREVIQWVSGRILYGA